MKKQLHISIGGKVTNVFFREFAKQHANKLGITGWAKNTKQGKLEIIVQGEQKPIDAFISACRRGPMGANVLSLDIKEEPLEEEFDYFDIRPT
ncbi:acylphosphatase [Candidatus Woesearchaeota archaeon]|nr:acylphosphatase [Candidatus Woesearchaeota archaeon]